MQFYNNSSDDSRINKIKKAPNLHILTTVRDHMSGLLYAVPYLRALRQQFPQAKITLLANPYASPILDGCPYIDQILPFFQFNRTTSRYARLRNLKLKTSAWLQLVGSVDLVVHFRNVGGETLLFSALLGKPYQVGYAQSRFDSLLDLNLGRPDVNLGSRQRNVLLIEALGLAEASTRMELWIDPQDNAWVSEWLRQNGHQHGKPIIVLHPGCHWGCNEWMPERWSMVGDSLSQRYGAQIIITGTKREVPLAERIAQGMATKPIIASGFTTLTQFAALISRAMLVASVDTAPTQICQALSIPSVILMGAGNMSWNGPLPGEPMVMLQEWDQTDEDDRKCDYSAGICHTSSCQSRLTGISLQKVLEAVENVLPLEGEIELRESVSFKNV